MVLVGVVWAPGVVPSLSGDDFVHLFKNRVPAVDWGSYFTTPDGREYRPLVRLSLSLDHWLWGDRYQGFHLSNLALHLVVTLLVYVWAFSFGGGSGQALTAMLLFGLHPIHSYSVSAVMGRTDILCAAFLLGSVLVWERGYLVSLLFFGAALLTKETALACPVYLLVQGLVNRRVRPGELLLRLLPFLLMVTVYLAFRLLRLPPSADDLAPYTQFSPLRILLNLAFYGGGLVIPFAGLQLRALAETAPLFLVPAALLGLILVSWLLWKWGFPPQASWMGALWVLICLLPVMLLFQRRFLYIPSAGFCLAVAFWLCKPESGPAKWLLRALCVAYFAASLGSSLQWRAAGWETKTYLESAARLVSASPDEAWFALNVPNGIGEAHVFTHESLRYALGLQLGSLPRVTILTRLQLDRPVSVRTTEAENGIVTSIQPGPGDYFVFDAPELLSRGGRFLPLGTTVEKNGFRIAVVDADGSGRPSQVSVSWDPGASGRLLVFEPDRRPRCRVIELEQGSWRMGGDR